MPLTDDHTQHFRTHGYVLVADFFGPDEVRALKADVARLQEQGLLRNVRTEQDGKTQATNKQNLQLCPMSPHSELVKALPFEPKVIEAVTRLIGPEIVLHLDQVFLKPGLRGTGTNWHQDNAYFQIPDPLQGTAMWIAVDDATIANGTMRLIPDAFREPLPHDRDPESDHHIRCYPDEQQSIAAELPAGGVAFFCYGTPHCTMANNTLQDRAGIALHFLTAEAVKQSPQQEQFLPNRDYRPVLTGPEASDGFNEYGRSMAGRFRGLIDEMLQPS